MNLFPLRYITQHIDGTPGDSSTHAANMTLADMTLLRDNAHVYNTG